MILHAVPSCDFFGVSGFSCICKCVAHRCGWLLAVCIHICSPMGYDVKKRGFTSSAPNAFRHAGHLRLRSAMHCAMAASEKAWPHLIKIRLFTFSLSKGHMTCFFKLSFSNSSSSRYSASSDRSAPPPPLPPSPPSCPSKWADDPRCFAFSNFFNARSSFL